MSLKKPIKNILVFLSACILLCTAGCDPGKQNPDAAVESNTINGKGILEYTRLKYNPNAHNAFYGVFLDAEKYAAVTVEEVSNISDWGIRFVLLNPVNDTLEVVYTSSILEGSLQESILKPCRIKNFDYDMLYYNSGSYFLGSGGGDVYVYLADFERKIIYQAYGEVNNDGALILHIYSNLPEEVYGFIISELKTNFSSLIINHTDRSS